MHAGQLSVSHRVVRELADDQFPSWRDLAIKAVESAGTVNAIFRIGDRLAARAADYLARQPPSVTRVWPVM